MQSPNLRPRVSIGIATYLRVKGLTRLLQSLSKLDGLEGNCSYADISVWVVDNDENESARQIVHEFASNSSSFKIDYRVEPRRGIPFARNCFVRNALADSDWLAFIDDDEAVEATWLKELLKVAENYNADVVTGPVFPVFTETPPDWAIQGGFYNRRRMPSGTSVTWAATNNTLVHSNVFKRMQNTELTSWFDENMGLRGGSDLQFFLRVHKMGFKMIWCDTAIAKEYFSKSRINQRWVFSRFYRCGNSDWYIYRSIWPLPKALALTLIAGARAFCGGLIYLLLSFIPMKGSTFRRVRAIRSFCYNIGQITGFFRIWYFEYKKIHGE